MDISHILYNTVGTEFEKYLGGSELMILSKVSRTTREGELGTNFRNLLEITDREYQTFIDNNPFALSAPRQGRSGVSVNDFFENIPLGVMFRDYVLPKETNFNILLGYLNISHEVKFYSFMELTSLDDFKKYFEVLKNKKIKEPDHPYFMAVSMEKREPRPYLNIHIYEKYIFQASIRGREDIVEYLFQQSTPDFREGLYYPASDNLKHIYTKYKGYAAFMEDNHGFYLMLSGKGSHPFFTTLVWLVTCFQEQDVLRNYCGKDDETFTRMLEYIKPILDNPNLKYNINRYHDAFKPLIRYRYV